MTTTDYSMDMIAKLKEELSKVITPEFTDNDFLRWLEHYDYDLASITPILRSYFRFLRSYDFSKYPTRYDMMFKYWSNGFIDVPGKGSESDHFVTIETMGTLDGEGVVKCVPLVQIVLHRFYSVEFGLKALRQYERTTGRQAGGVFIFDLEGIQFSGRWLTLMAGPFKCLIRLLLRYYSVLAHYYIVVNAPPYSSFLYNIFKPILTKNVRKKVVVLGSNWKAEILNYVDPNALPIHYGGNLVDENNDPKCQTKVVYTSKVPSHLFRVPSKDEPTYDELIKLTVGPGEVKYITVDVEEKGSILEWFYVVDKDWGFGVFFTEDKNALDPETMEMVYPQFDHLGGPSYMIEQDKIECKHRGCYKIWFSNAFSWFTKLHVRYEVRVTKPSR